jgi:uncharacterized protein
MRVLFFTILFFCFVFTANAQDFYGSTDLKMFRDGRNAEMLDKKETALTDDDFPLFKSLEYFETSEKYRVTAKLTETPNQKSFKLLTSSGKTKIATKVGYLNFKLGKKSYKLNVYQLEAVAKQEAYKDLLFVPFKDLTNGNTSYGGGRFLDIWKPKSGDEVILDFNLAYNPSCAYGSGRFSCPIPPKENFLKTAIEAGEMKFVSPSGKGNH